MQDSGATELLSAEGLSFGPHRKTSTSVPDRGVIVIRICIGLAAFGVKLNVYRYQARRAYAGQGRHWKVAA